LKDKAFTCTADRRQHSHCSAVCPAITMATMLPVIKPLVSSPGRSCPAVQDNKVTKKSMQTGSSAVVLRKMLNKKEQELQERRLAARAKLPQLTEWQTDE